jgi:hypothetical protein
VVEAMQHSGEKIHYLSLALDARLAIKALRQKSAPYTIAPQLRDSVKAALDSLKAINRGGELYARLGELEPYEHFEQMYTLREVAASLKDSNLVEELQALSESESPSQEARAAALKFFSEVERRALHYYSDPSLSEQGG